ncbi:MAG TPA: cyclic pyranopterin monophosphate synthase MoaC [Candidatus Dormibacteraeota bacterium]|nr:cyclic pyranopterin monophosphate synthase MoaC [Candidatus Dormibacteraeota bacterium]
MQKPSHIRADGVISMVDVGEKSSTERFARAEALVRMSVEAAAALRAAMGPKGDAFVTAQIAGIMAAKQTASLIPLTHPVALAHVGVELEWIGDSLLRIECSARSTGQTGVEMEAMIGASVAALTIYDMSKALDRSIVVDSIRLLEKSGGKSGTWRATQ